MVLRQRPMKLARSPIRAGSIASMRSRTRRATTGEAPPVPTATTTSPRSTIAGKINVECCRSSITLTGRPTALARADIAGPSSPAPAQSTAITPRKIGCQRIAFGVFDPRGVRRIEPAHIVTGRRSRTSGCVRRPTAAGAASPAPVRHRQRAGSDRSADRGTLAGIACETPLPEFRGLTRIIFYLCLLQAQQRENYFFSIAVQL